MKKIVFITLSLFFGLISNAQIYNGYLKGISKADTNFYEVKTAGEAYFAQDSTLRDGNKYGYKEFLRWSQFWSERVYNEQGNIGDIKKYYEVVGGYSQNRSAICGSSGLGYSWDFLGPKNLPDQYLGMITSVAYFDDGTTKTIFAGSAAGGIFITNDLNANANWTCITEDLNMPGIGFSDLRILDDPANTKRYLFAGTGLLHRGYGVGILRLNLLNSSAGWEEVTGLPQQGGGVLQSMVNQVVLHPTDKNKVFALIGNSLYTSNSHGDPGSWQLVFSASGNHQLSKLIFHPADPDKMYISSYSTANPCVAPPVIWKSIDGGINWSIMSASFNLPNSARIDIATSPILPNATDPNQDPLYVAFSEVLDCQVNPVTTGSTTEIYLYDNGITEFVPYSSIGSQDTYITRHLFEISQNPLNITGTDPDMYFASLGFHQISNSVFGAAYRDAFDMHDDIRDMEIIPDYDGDGKENILIANDGGISLSTDNGDNWINMNGPGLNTTMFWGIDVAESNSDIIVGGTQDNNAYKHEISTNTWTKFSSGDVYKFQLSELDGETYFFANNPGNYGAYISSLSNPGTSGIRLVPPPLTSLSGPVGLPQYQHPSGVIYYGQKEVGILEPPCYGARFISNIYQAEGLTSTLTAIGVCEYNPDVIYIGYDGPEQGNNPNPKKVFKTINASATTPVWVDITANIQTLTPGIFDWIQISDIVVNPTNENEVWITFRNISYDFQGNGTLRVIHSIDGGDNWSDYSINLPVVPVNDLEYLNGSVGGLYAATDVGIYFTDASSYTTDGWKCINENLPVLLVNDIEINYDRKKIVAGTFGRGIYESDIHTVPPYTPNTANPFSCTTALTTISTNTTISADQSFCGDIEIEPGATLTVTGTLLMGPETEIRVKNATVPGISGGKLIIDGGTITSLVTCNETGRWKGIFVMGDPTKSQAPLNTSVQGVLRIINGGTVSNAKVGAYSGKLTSFSLSGPTIVNQGGIIITDNAFFKNNLKDVMFWPYTNYLNNPSNVIANRSRFTNTKFQTLTGNTINLLIPTENSQHMVLFGADGVLFLGCTFENLRNMSATVYQGDAGNPSFVSMSGSGIGIYAINSSFRVTGFCEFYNNPDPSACSLDKNTFRNLFYGIKAISSNPLKTAFIDGNYFNDNYHAVFINGMDYSYIVQNLFQIKNLSATVTLNVPTAQGTDIPYGLHLNQCSNYRVTENHFKSSTIQGQNNCNNNNLKIDLQISLPDGNPEEIYNNYFTDYHSNKDIDPGVAILVQGDPNDNDPNNVAKLQLRCNDFNGAAVGGAERYTQDIALVQNGKINENQGSNSNGQSPAGNTFGTNALQHDICLIGDNDNCVDFANSDGEFNTSGGLLPGNITYYHHQNTSAFPLDVQCGSTDVINNIAPVNYVSKQDACPSIIDPNPQPHVLRQTIRAYQIQSENEVKLIDAGNTQGLLNLIYGNASPGQVKNALMDASPYLSDAVLMAYLYDAPPHGHLKEVVLANSPVTQEVKTVIDGMSLPNGIRNQINAAQTGVSERQNLEARVDWFDLQREQNINDLVRYHLQRDTLPDHLDSLKLVFSQYSVQHSDCKLASAFASQKDYVQALAIIDAHLAVNPDDVLCRLQKLMIEFDQELSWCLNPTQDQKDKLEEIKDEPHKGCVAAKGLIELIEGLPLEDYRVLPQSNRSMLVKEEKEKLKEEENVQVYPNPTTHWLTVNINNNEKQIYFVSVFDMTGKRIISESLTKNTFDFDLSKFSRGLYSIQIRTETEIIYNGKIVKE